MQDAEAAAVFAMTIRDGITGLVGVANRAAESFPDPTYARRFAAVANLLSELQGHPNIRALNAPAPTGAQPDA